MSKRNENIRFGIFNPSNHETRWVMDPRLVKYSLFVLGLITALVIMGNV